MPYFEHSQPLVAWAVSGAVLVAATVWLKSLWKQRGALPTIICQDVPLNRYIMEKCSRMRRPFNPTLWARNAHLQTILPIVLPRAKVSFKREVVPMKDQGVVCLDWVTTKERELSDSSPVLITLPGLTGDAESQKNLCMEAISSGFRCVVFNKRGHGGTELLTPKFQSFGDPSDFREIVLHIRRRFPDAKITGIGSSAGGALLASYLGEFGADCHLAAAVCISPGYDAHALFHRGEHVVRQPYNRLMLSFLKQIFKRHLDVFSNTLDPNVVLNTKTLAEYEEAVYSKIYGFKTMDAYWEVNNPNRNLFEITIPILCINSKDDPICIKELIPCDLFSLHPNSCLVLTERGGHLGFLEGVTAEPWGDKMAVEYIKAAMEFSSLN